MRPALPPSVAGLLLVLLAACDGTADQPMSPSLAKAPSGPTVTGTSPSASVRDTTLVVQVLGSGFDNGSQVQFLLGGVADPKVVTNNVAFVSATRLDANVTVATDAVAAFRDVAVTTAGGKKGIGTEKFQVLAVQQLSGGAGFAQGTGGGLVVGRVGTGCNGQLPALWDQAGVLAYLPLPPGACSGWAIAIGGTGQILGGVRTDPANAGRWSVARWTPGPSGYVPEFLGYWTDGSNIEASDINASGNFIATAYTSTGDWIPLWRAAGGGWVPLSMPAGVTRCIAHGMTDADLIVGACYIAGIASPVAWPTPTSAPVVLPRLPSYNSHQHAVAVNDGGEAAGYAQSRTKSGSTQEVATRWHFDGSVWQVEALGNLGGGSSSARGIDEDGAVVGWSYTSGNGSKLTAFLWRPGAGMKALAGLGSESQALGIASDPSMGQVVVGGTTLNGNWNPARWRP